MTGPVLRCEELTVRYGRFTALRAFSYAFRPGRVYAVIGPNGAGKTTLMNVLAGGVRPSAGAVFLGGRDVSALPAHARSRLGLGRSFQVTRSFAGMTVFENLRLAAQARAWRWQPAWRGAGSFPDTAARAEAMLHLVGLEHEARRPAEQLSHGDGRALELGLALMTNPAVLLLDEPLAGVGHGALDRMAELLVRVSANRTVLLIEHNMTAVMRLAGTVLVMAEGALLAEGPPEEVRRDPRVREAYLGSEAGGGEAGGSDA